MSSEKVCPDCDRPFGSVEPPKTLYPYWISCATCNQIYVNVEPGKVENE